MKQPSRFILLSATQTTPINNRRDNQGQYWLNFNASIPKSRCLAVEKVSEHSQVICDYVLIRLIESVIATCDSVA